MKAATITPPEVDKVIELLQLAQQSYPEFGRFLHLAVTTGARRGELCALRWEDIDWEAETFGLGVVAESTGRGCESTSIEPLWANCRVALSEANGEPVARAFVEDPDGPVRLISTTDGWLYERPSAKPMAPAYSDRVVVANDAEAQEHFIEDRSVLAVVGTDQLPRDPSAEPVLTDTVFDDNEVTTTASSSAPRWSRRCSRPRPDGP